MTSSIAPEALTVVSFVRNSLGCDCPDEVFSHILVESPEDALAHLSVNKLLKIGGRLMTAICLPSVNIDVFDNLQQLFSVGKRLRDQAGFNRFRLVVISGNPEEITPKLCDRFTQLTGLDDRIHLHVVSPSELPDCLK